MSDLVQQINRTLDEQTWVDRYSVPVQNAVQRFFQSAGAAGSKIADFLHGVWLGHPLHPVLTDIPIGAWTAAVALDMMESNSVLPGIGKAADTAVAIGVAGAAGSAVTGITDWQHTVGNTRRAGFIHASLNVIALGFFIASMVARKNRSRGLGQSLALTGYTIAAASAYVGGDLVYRQKMGINHAPLEGDLKTKQFVPVISADDLPQNQLTRASVNGTSIVLLRRGEQVFALAERCAHLGGPLAEGSLDEGEAGRPIVVCPWHSSRFYMDTGDIAGGPTTYPQPCFEARIANGQVEVYHP